MNFFGYSLVKSSELTAQSERENAQRRKLDSLSKVMKDIKLSIETSQAVTTANMEKVIKERRKTVSRPLHYRPSNSESEIGIDRKDTNYEYFGPVYDLSEIGRAEDVEPYVKQSVRKHREQILKEGFSVNCQDEEIEDYIEKRLFEMSLVSGITTSDWMRQFTTTLVTYGTAFLVIKRDANRSSGKSIRMYGKDREPIAAVYPMDPTCVTVALNEYGHPVRWKQRIENAIGIKKELVFEADDVIVATIDKKPGFVFGSPYILPTLDDVRSLRRLEELAELLAQRNCFPLMHWKVGTDEMPAVVFEDGSDEVNLVRSLVESMPTEGGVVTSHRVDAALIGGDKQTLDLVPYLEYFEKRVMAGLRLSDVDLGRGDASKASAVTVSQGLQDAAKDFQAVIKDVLAFYLLMPLALEGGFDIDPNENMPTLEFTTINPEDQRAEQAHGQDLFNGGTITHDEFRQDYLKKKPLTEEEQARLHPNMEHARAKELQEMTGEQAIQKAKVSKSQANKNKVSNRTRPKNQSGRKATKTKVTKNSLEILKESYDNNLTDVLSCTREALTDMIVKHGTGVVSDSDPYNLTTKEEEIQAVFAGFLAHAGSEARKFLDPIIKAGCKDAMEELGLSGQYEMSKKNLDRFYKNYVEKSFSKLIDTGIELINNNDGLAGIETSQPMAFYVNGIVDQLLQDIKTLTDKQIDVAYRVGFARAARSHGVKTVVLTPDVDGWYCEDCEETGEVEVSLIDKNQSYASLLTTHLNCDYSITIGEK